MTDTLTRYRMALAAKAAGRGNDRDIQLLGHELQRRGLLSDSRVRYDMALADKAAGQGNDRDIAIWGAALEREGSLTRTEVRFDSALAGQRAGEDNERELSVLGHELRKQQAPAGAVRQQRSPPAELQTATVASDEGSSPMDRHLGRLMRGGPIRQLMRSASPQERREGLWQAFEAMDFKADGNRWSWLGWDLVKNIRDYQACLRDAPGNRHEIRATFEDLLLPAMAWTPEDQDWGLHYDLRIENAVSGDGLLGIVGGRPVALKMIEYRSHELVFERIDPRTWRGEPWFVLPCAPEVERAVKEQESDVARRGNGLVLFDQGGRHVYVAGSVYDISDPASPLCLLSGLEEALPPPDQRYQMVCLRDGSLVMLAGDPMLCIDLRERRTLWTESADEPVGVGSLDYCEELDSLVYLSRIPADEGRESLAIPLLDPGSGRMTRRIRLGETLGKRDWPPLCFDLAGTIAFLSQMQRSSSDDSFDGIEVPLGAVDLVENTFEAGARPERVDRLGADKSEVISELIVRESAVMRRRSAPRPASVV